MLPIQIKNPVRSRKERRKGMLEILCEQLAKRISEERLRRKDRLGLDVIAAGPTLISI